MSSTSGSQPVAASHGPLFPQPSRNRPSATRDEQPRIAWQPGSGCPVREGCAGSGGTVWPLTALFVFGSGDCAAIIGIGSPAQPPTWELHHDRQGRGDNPNE